MNVRRSAALCLGTFALAVSAFDVVATAAPQDPATSPAATPRAQLPTPEVIILKCYEAMGGVEKVDAVKSLSRKGVLTFPNGSANMELASVLPMRFRLLQAMPGGASSTAVFDGEVAWVDLGSDQYQLLDEAAIKQVSEQPNMHGWLLDLRRYLPLMSTMEVTRFADAMCHKVRIDLPGEDNDTYAFFNVETGLYAGMEAVQMTGIGAQTSTCIVSEWIDVEGIKMFSKIDMTMMTVNAILTFSDFTFNGVETSIFERPAGVKALVEEAKAQQARPEAAPPATTP